MIRNLIFFLLVLAVTAFLGYRMGQSKAKDNIAKQITLGSKMNGSWKYVNTEQHTPESRISSFLMASQEILGGNHEQSMFLIAVNDADGEKINSDHQYIIEGGSIPAECWNLSVYDPENLIGSEQGYFVSNHMVQPGLWNVLLSSGGSNTKNSLSLGKQTTSAAVVLRIYNPQPELIEDLEFIQLPTIKKIES